MLSHQISVDRNEEDEKNKRVFEDLLELKAKDGTPKWGLAQSLNDFLKDKTERVILDFRAVQEYDPAMAMKLIHHPSMVIPAFEDKLKELVQRNASGFRHCQVDPKIGLENIHLFGSTHVTPRGLTNSFIGKLCCVEGIVVRATEPRPRLTHTVQFVPATGNTLVTQHTDTASLKFNTGSSAPRQDRDGNVAEVEHGLSRYKDSQRFSIQECPESAPSGVLPRSVDVICESDLTTLAKPGERVRVIGVYKPLPYIHQGATNGRFNVVLLANNILPMHTAKPQIHITQKDKENIEALAADKDAFEILAQSIAPSICGHEGVKRGLLLLLVGGVEKNLEGGSHLRGDVNILLVGDPSCGKSQMLRFAMKISPLSLSTTGRGSSGVGLTAIVTQDPETKERRIEAGAMVLADRGLVCIDEFDKMAIYDRTAIHEVMEQQTVSIAKAGIHMTLNARCSVLAAANPVYGTFDDKLTLSQNIGLPDSLLSRFDLVFVVRDLMTPEDDRRVAEQVLRQCRYRGKGARHEDHKSACLAGRYDADFTEKDENDDDEMYETNREGLYTGNARPLSFKFLRKYIQYVKHHKTPILSKEACTRLSEAYGDLRLSENRNAVCITPRTLEGLIRMATAHAKLLLKDTVTPEDVDLASNLLKISHGESVQSVEERHQKEQEAAAVKADVSYEEFMDLLLGVFTDVSDNSKDKFEIIHQVNAGRAARQEDAIPELVFDRFFQQMETENRIVIDQNIVYLMT
jgi:DNA replication licensing factor MCM3